MAIQDLIASAQHNFDSECSRLNLEVAVTTASQRALEKKSGTPLAFALACRKALGEIDYISAIVAVRKYQREWRESA